MSENITTLSKAITDDALLIIKEMIDAGRSNTILAYAAAILITDFLFKAGLTSQEAKDRVFLVSDLMTALKGAADLSNVFGGLKTYVRQTGGGKAAALAGAKAGDDD